jgi:hypothetical protein
MYKVYILREREIYSHLNMLRKSGVIFTGLVWCPKTLKFDRLANEMMSSKGLNGF